jgi:type VI secretion system protein ImpA
MSETAELMLADLSEEAPAGEDLENDPDFTAMERAAERKPETQHGDVITPAEPPNWKEVDALASSLLERTRDLRVLVHQAVARLNLTGIPVFSQSLARIAQLLETRWEVVHPRLDPEDDNDPTLRANTLSRLRDERNVLRPLREIPLARSPQTGPVSWRDIAIFLGILEPEEGKEKPNEALIRDAFNRTNQQQLQALHEAVDLSVSQVASISTTFDNLAGPYLDLESLTKLLSDIQRALKRFEPIAGQEPVEATESGTEVEAEADAGATGGSSQAAAGGARRPIMSIRSITNLSGRDDALYLMELVASYFRASEPSSPVPLLIDRARRLANMDFIDILRDLAPDGIGQAQIVAGQLPE